MNQVAISVAGPSSRQLAQTITWSVIAAITLGHLLNDLMQSVVVAVYPMLKENYHLSYTEIGAITCTNQVTASLLQPLVGITTDRRPIAFALAIGMGFTLVGLVVLSAASSLPILLVAAGLVGMGSSVFHPEGSRITRLASGGRYGLAQSVFQVGGNFGTSLGPLLVAAVILPRGQGSIAWCALAAMIGICVLIGVGRWYRPRMKPRVATTAVPSGAPALSRRRIGWTLGVLGLLVFSKYIYLTSLTSYYTLYLIAHFHLTMEAANVQLFAFLFAVAAGTMLGGPIGDRIGRKRVIWASILGIAPFTLAMPYVSLFWTEVLAMVIGFILASAFSAILVYAQELVPGRVGLVSGMFFGFAFGVAGIGAAALGLVADSHGLDTVYRLCSFLPLLGIVTAALPDIEPQRRRGGGGHAPAAPPIASGNQAGPRPEAGSAGDS